MTQPKAIVFDIGNVLIRWDPDQLYKQLLPDVEERTKLFRDVDLHGMNDRIDRGAPFKETIYTEADKHPQWRDLIRVWHDRWIEMATPAIEGSWEILRALKAQDIPVFALSNFGVGSFEYAETIYPELKEFDQRYISGYMKVIKPEPRIYEMLETESGLSGSELFFADDREDNIAAARERGWTGHVFKSPEGLRSALANVGIKV